METKFKLGDDVVVEFIGKITAINLNSDNKIEYAIDGDKPTEAFARRVKESQMCYLPKPEDYEKK